MSNKKQSREDRKIRTKKIPEKKLKTVKEITNLIKENKTFMIVSIKGLPSKQFQEIKKKLRKDVKIKITRKSTAQRAVDALEKGAVKGIKENIGENCALLFSNIDCFELSAILSESKTPAKAKIGQIADEDIKIEPGETELTPGPVISEFGNLGIKIAIEEGKINIKDEKVIVKKGEKVTEAAASIMGKLDITPSSVGLIPVAAYDSQEEKTYTNIIVDKIKTLSELKKVFAKTKSFAISIRHICKDTIGVLLAKAASHARALENLKPKEEKKEEKEEAKAEEKKREKSEEKSEGKKEEVKENKDAQLNEDKSKE